ncbi:MAG: YibE/F family protein [Bacillota bacterium]|nr:YibE/F family protein [Bacillota bacterium]
MTRDGRDGRDGSAGYAGRAGSAGWLRDLAVSAVALAVLAAAWFVWVRPGQGRHSSMVETVVTRARVEAVTEDLHVDIAGDPLPDGRPLAEGEAGQRRLRFTARLTSGPGAGTVVMAEQLIDNFLDRATDYAVRPGSRVLLQPMAVPTADEGGGGGTEAQGAETGAVSWRFVNYNRLPWIVGLGVVFALALILYGRRQGVRTLVSLVLTFVAVFAILIPAILQGENIYVTALFVCIYTIVMTYSLVNGVNRMTAAASLSCTVGLVASGLISLIMSRVLRLSGFVSEEATFLHMTEHGRQIDMRALLFAAILIGSLGALMDVAMSIASALREMQEISPGITRRRLRQAGIAVGRDVMGTMTNTLILAYIGSQLVAVLLMISIEGSLYYLLNIEAVAIDILQALIGSIGLLLTLPAAAWIAAWLYAAGRGRGGGGLDGNDGYGGRGDGDFGRQSARRERRQTPGIRRL